MEKITFSSIFRRILIPTVFMAGIAWITIFYYSYHAMPIMITSKAVMIMILILSFSMCSLNGINDVIRNGPRKSPLALKGLLLGILVLFLLGSGILGWHIPFLRYDRDIMLTAAILIAAKYLLGTLNFLFTKRPA